MNGDRNTLTVVHYLGREIADVVLDALSTRAAELDIEQAVYGLDALDELELHVVIAAGLSASGLGVHREQPYPTMGQRQRQTERQRCDLVLTPEPGLPLRDERESQLAREAHASTLFADVIPPQPPEVEPEACAWIEVKVVGQFCLTQGIAGPNTAYAAELVGALRTDLKKLASEPQILIGGVLLVLFTAEEIVAEHDIAAAVHRVLDRGVSVGEVTARHAPLNDRLGNSCLSVVTVTPGRDAPAS